MEMLQAENLKNILGVKHGFFTRNKQENANIYDSLDNAHIGVVMKNRAQIAARFGVVPEYFLTCRQVHSSRVVTVTTPWKLDGSPDADAMVTGKSGIALGILTADCVPVLFADEKSKVIGAVHAGWRGAIGGIIGNTLSAMESLGAKYANIKAALGPCIFQNSYEVGPDFPAHFLAENSDNERLFKPSTKKGHYLFDLPGYVIKCLRYRGIEDISPPAFDTYADPARFISYRRCCLDKTRRVGNQISVIVLST